MYNQAKTTKETMEDTVELVYETETDPDTFEVTELDKLDTPMCTFADISIMAGLKAAGVNV